MTDKPKTVHSALCDAEPNLQAIIDRWKEGKATQQDVDSLLGKLGDARCVVPADVRRAKAKSLSAEKPLLVIAREKLAELDAMPRGIDCPKADELREALFDIRRAMTPEDRDTLDAEARAKDQPYLEETFTRKVFNPEYGRDRQCKCGHPYYRHFDGNAPVGCNDVIGAGTGATAYCHCDTFVEEI